MAPLKRRGERLEGGIGMGARERRDAVGNVRGESSGPPHQRSEFGCILAPDADRFDNAKGRAGPRRRARRAEVAQRSALQRRALCQPSTLLRGWGATRPAQQPRNQ